MNPLAVITAKANSTRLPGKNMLPLGGKPLSFWSVDDARSLGLQTVVSTDIPELTEYAISRGCAVVRQNAGDGVSHAEVIREAVAGRAYSSCVLLQPTSPFRGGRIITKCLAAFYSAGAVKTVVTTNTVHMAPLTNGSVINRERSVALWDGNVAVFAPGHECDFVQCIGVPNLPANSLQIDTEHDYVAACATLEMLRPVRPCTPPAVNGAVAAMLMQAGITPGVVTVVGRPGAIPEDKPVFYVNHCRGYEGGRVDGLFVIANPAIRTQGINEQLRQVAMRAKLVLVRDNGHLMWLCQNLPEINGKFFALRSCFDQMDDHLTSGAILCDILASCGYQPALVGAYRPGEIQSALLPFHRPAMSREIGLLWNAGVYGCYDGG